MISFFSDRYGGGYVLLLPWTFMYSKVWLWLLIKVAARFYVQYSHLMASMFNVWTALLALFILAAVADIDSKLYPAC
jgi:hypothetical protein